MLECDRPDGEKHNEPLDKNIFKPWFKFCPACGGEFVLNEKLDRYMCNKCGGNAFNITENYYFNYMRWRRETFKDYHHGD
jgi:ribosomal protein S27AE